MVCDFKGQLKRETLRFLAHLVTESASYFLLIVITGTTWACCGRDLNTQTFNKTIALTHYTFVPILSHRRTRQVSLSVVIYVLCDEELCNEERGITRAVCV